MRLLAVLFLVVLTSYTAVALRHVPGADLKHGPRITPADIGLFTNFASPKPPLPS